MNIDFDSQMIFGDKEGLSSFLLTHRFAHNEIQAFLKVKKGVDFSTFGLTDGAAEDEWAALMKAGIDGKKVGKPPEALRDWLQRHAELHIAEYNAILGTGTQAPDLSQVDFSVPSEFYDWMYAHQSMHDYEQQVLGFQ